MKRLLVLLLLSLATGVFAAGFGQAKPPAVSVQDRSGQALPLDTPLRDAGGGTVRLGDFFGTRPVVLVPAYWRCRTLFGTLMQGVLEAVADTGLPRDAYRVVGFSVDPDEGPADAAARQRSDLEYAAAYGSRATRSGSLPPPELHLLLGDAGLARRIGFDWQRTGAAEPADRWAHAAGFVVASPQGRIVQAFSGVRFDAAALRAAIDSAAREEARPSSLSSAFALLCAHFDPVEGRLSAPVMAGLRAGGIALVLGLGGWMLLHRRGRRSRP